MTVDVNYDLTRIIERRAREKAGEILLSKLPTRNDHIRAVKSLMDILNLSVDDLNPSPRTLSELVTDYQRATTASNHAKAVEAGEELISLYGYTPRQLSNLASRNKDWYTRLRKKHAVDKSAVMR